MRVFGTLSKMVRNSLKLKDSKTSVAPALLHLSILGYFKHRNPKPSNSGKGHLIVMLFSFRSLSPLPVLQSKECHRASSQTIRTCFFLAVITLPGNLK